MSGSSALVPLSVLDQHTIVLGKTGAGKSITLCGCVERLLDQEDRVCVVTPKGDWWGLKSSSDGKKPGYSVVIFGGPHADVPINPSAGKQVAEIVATGNHPSVIQFHGWMPSDRTRFWIDFASTLFNKNRDPLWLVIDEVHNFAPQGKVLDVEAGKALHWMNRLASEGRGIGIRLLMASQRPQKVHKDTVTSAETLIAMRVIHKLDRDQVKDWIDGAGDAERGKMVLNNLANMKRGEAYVWSPEVGFFSHVKFPMIKSFDSFQAPSREKKQKDPVVWADVDLDAVKQQLAQVIEQAKENDPAELKKEIRRLNAELIRQEIAKPKTDENAVEAARQVERKIGYERLRQADQRQGILLRAMREAITVLEGAIPEKIGPDGEIVWTMGGIMEHIPGLPVSTVEALKAPPITNHLYKHLERTRKAMEDGTVPVTLRAGARRMLAALVQWYPAGMSGGQLRAHSGMRKSGTYDAYIRDLQKAGFITTGGGDYYATGKGVDWLGDDVPAPRTTQEVLDIWLPKLRLGARRMLNYLVAIRGVDISHAELQAGAQLEKSGTYDAYVRDLKTARLIKVEDGRVRADKETLFL